MTKSIETQIDIEAPLTRVWEALTDHDKFGEWFGARIQSPFAAGRTSIGKLTVPGFEHVQMELFIKELRPETYFAYRWHPYAVDPERDYSEEEPTLVEFRLESIASGTRLSITESGFEALPENRQAEAFRMNEGGWQVQSKRIADYVTGNA